MIDRFRAAYSAARRSLNRRWHHSFGHGDRRYHEVSASSWAGHTLWCYSCGEDYDAPVR